VVSMLVRGREQVFAQYAFVGFVEHL